MDTPVSACPRVLIVEDDRDIRETLELLLEQEGYAPRAVSSLGEALALVDAQSFGCILTDLFAQQTIDLLGSIAPLQRLAHPTPIIVVTGWPVSSDEAQQRGFSGVVAKPFDLDDLLATIAASVAIPLRAELEPQVRAVHDYFAALTGRDWDALVALCTDDVTYVLPGALPYSGTVRGKAAFRTYTEETYQDFPDAVFDHVRVYAQPRGLAARFHGRWHGADGSEHEQSGSVTFQFAGERIAHIGVALNTERLQALVQTLRSRVSQRPSAST